MFVIEYYVLLKCLFYFVLVVVIVLNGCLVSVVVVVFDLFDDGYQQDLFEYVCWVCEWELVFYSLKFGYWIVMCYDDIKVIFCDNFMFSLLIVLEKIILMGVEVNVVFVLYGFVLNCMFVNEDEFVYMLCCCVLLDLFMFEVLKYYELMVCWFVCEYVDCFIDDGCVDLVDQMLWEVLLIVVLYFFGVLEEDMDMLCEYLIVYMINMWGCLKLEEQVVVVYVVGKFWQFVGKVFDKMCEDLFGLGWMQYGICKQKVLFDVIIDLYLYLMMMVGIVVVYEMIVNVMVNVMKLLLQYFDVWCDICDDLLLILNVVEECLCYNGLVVVW